MSTQGWGFVRAEPPEELSSPLPARGCSPLFPPPPQDQKILLAIYNISMSLRDVAGGTLRGPEEVAVRKVARNTEFVLRENCRKIGKVGALPLPSLPSSSQFPGCTWGVTTRAVLLSRPAARGQELGFLPRAPAWVSPGLLWGTAGETPAWRLSCPNNSLTKQLINQLISGEAPGWHSAAGGISLPLWGNQLGLTLPGCGLGTLENHLPCTWMCEGVSGVGAAGWGGSS